MTVPDEILAANERFAAERGERSLPAPPARAFVVVTCMDARIDPVRALGLAEGDAHVLRNAGAAVTDDVLRSLAVSHWVLGTREAVVIGHTDCGLGKVTNESLRGRLRAGGVEATEVDFLPFSDLDESVRTAVTRIRDSALLPDSFGSSGFVYDVQTARLRHVV